MTTNQPSAVERREELEAHVADVRRCLTVLRQTPAKMSVEGLLAAFDKAEADRDAFIRSAVRLGAKVDAVAEALFGEQGGYLEPGDLLAEIKRLQTIAAEVVSDV